MSFTIRNAVPGDGDAVVQLWRACDLVASYNDPYADFRFALSGLNSTVLVAVEEADCIVGSVLVGHDGHRGWLYYVASAPSRRCDGVGRTIVEAGERWLRQRGVPKVQLMVRETNAIVVPFYERLGYEHAPRVIMSKWLDQDQRKADAAP